MSLPPQLARFMEATLAQIPATASEEQKRSFSDDLSSPQGMPNRRPFTELSGYARIQATSMSFLGARLALEDLRSTRLKIVSIRSIKMTDRLEHARLSSWHYQYVLRERLRGLLDHFKEAVDAPASDLSKIAAAYKKGSDRLLAARHRSVHEYDHHDPLIRQVEAHELLSLRPPQGAATEKFYKTARLSAERRAKLALVSTLTQDEDMFIEMTDKAFVDSFGLRSVWSFKP